MWMRPHIQALAGREFRRAHVVEEDERADEAPRKRRKKPSHLETADVARPRVDDRGDRGCRRTSRARRLGRRQDAQAGSSSWFTTSRVLISISEVSVL